MVDWNRLASIATVLAFFAIVITLSVTVWILLDSHDQLNAIKSTVDALNKLIKQNSELLDKENLLVELQIQQLSTTKETLNQTQERALQYTFLWEGDHSVVVEDCTYNHDNESISYNTVVLTEKQKPSLLPFFVTMDLSYYVKDKNQNTIPKGKMPAFSTVLDPVNSNWFLNVDISQILKENNQSNYSELYIRSQYTYAPYSYLEKGPTIAPPTLNVVGQLLLGFKKDQNDRWQLITDNANIQCK